MSIFAPSYICTYVHLPHVSLRIRPYVPVCICSDILLRWRIFANTRTYICDYVLLRIRTSALIYNCAYIHLRLHTFMLTYFCAYVHLRILMLALTSICAYAYLRWCIFGSRTYIKISAVIYLGYTNVHLRVRTFALTYLAYICHTYLYAYVHLLTYIYLGVSSCVHLSENLPVELGALIIRSIFKKPYHKNLRRFPEPRTKGHRDRPRLDFLQNCCTGSTWCTDHHEQTG